MSARSPDNPHILSAMTIDDPTAFIRGSMPLCGTLGVEADLATPETVRLSMPWRADLCTLGGVLHGGSVMALADSAGAVCAFLNLPEGKTGTSTIESKTNFLRGVRGGTVVAVARPLHVGSMTIVVETEMWNDDRLVAKVTQTQAVLGSS
jgi:1,4-dihydroxy-2-naphthoyl-CoA hydrolase